MADDDQSRSEDEQPDAVAAGADPPTEDDDEGSDDDIPSRLRELGSYIRNQRKTAQLSLRNLAKIAGVSNPYLSQIERGLRKPSAEILQAIAKALEISSETLYVKAGILEEREGGPDLESMIARDPHLTEPQRQTLIEMYRSFRRLSELEDAGGEAGGGAGGDAGGPEEPRRGPLQGLIDAVGTGDLDEEELARAARELEDDEA